MSHSILIVDDQTNIRLMVEMVLQEEGYQTFTAGTGLKALEILQQEHIDLVLLDMKLPFMDGLEIMRNMNDLNLKVQIIMMTAYGEIDLIDKAKELGATCHLHKPFDIYHMKQLVADHLSGEKVSEWSSPEDSKKKQQSII